MKKMMLSAVAAVGVMFFATSGYSQEAIYFMAQNPHTVEAGGVVSADPAGGLTLHSWGGCQYMGEGFELELSGQVLGNLSSGSDVIFTNPADVLEAGSQLEQITYVGSCYEVAQFDVFTAVVVEANPEVYLESVGKIKLRGQRRMEAALDIPEDNEGDVVLKLASGEYVSNSASLEIRNRGVGKLVATFSNVEEICPDGEITLKGVYIERTHKIVFSGFVRSEDEVCQTHDRFKKHLGRFLFKARF